MPCQFPGPDLKNTGSFYFLSFGILIGRNLSPCAKKPRHFCREANVKPTASGQLRLSHLGSGTLWSRDKV